MISNGNSFVGKHNVDLITRFWACVEKTDYCWIWTGNKTAVYGRIRVNGRQTPAHRASWIIHNGKIPDGLKVLHKCDNPLCVNPDHLELGSQKKNISDAVTRDRHSSCRQGSDHNAAKLSDDQVIRLLTCSSKETRNLASEFGVSKSTVSAIRRGERYETLFLIYGSESCT